MIALCAPSDFYNPFVPVAVEASGAAALLVLSSGAFFAVARTRSRSPAVARVASVDSFATLFLGCALTGLAIWLWAQAHSFISSCSAGPIVGQRLLQLQIQLQHAQLASTLDGLILLTTVLVLVACSVALFVSNARSSARVRPA